MSRSTLAFLLALTTLCAVAWFAVPNVPGVVEAAAVGVVVKWTPLLLFAVPVGVACWPFVRGAVGGEEA